MLSAEPPSLSRASPAVPRSASPSPARWRLERDETLLPANPPAPAGPPRTPAAPAPPYSPTCFWMRLPYGSHPWQHQVAALPAERTATAQRRLSLGAAPER